MNLTLSREVSRNKTLLVESFEGIVEPVCLGQLKCLRTPFQSLKLSLFFLNPHLYTQNDEAKTKDRK